jgi:Tol biopolymer transport system component/DNA-binding winged helix-turn-helix (wHTH) protein
MNGVQPPLKSGRPLDIGAESDFRLGALRVDPATRTVSAGGRKKSIEPRVMQVLVALARAEGGVVSRDQLIDRCWGGRIVSDDAINSCLAKVRALRDFVEGPSFEIETIPRVGYRLRTDAEPTQNSHSDRPFPRQFQWRFWGLLGVLGLLAAAYAAKFFLDRPAANTWQVASYDLVANSSMEERMPALSPDAKFLVYWAAPDLSAATRLYLKNISQDQTAPFSTPPIGWGDLAPSWSPQGDRVAFVRMRESPSPTAGVPCSIVIKVVPNGSEQQVGHCGAEPYTARLSWGHDGSSLYFADQPAASTSFRIRTLDLASGRMVDITHPPTGAGDYDANISPDGGRLAFVRHRAGDIKDVFVRELGSTKLTQVTRDGASLYTAWAPDGQSLFITSSRNGSSDVWSAPADGSGMPRRLLVGLGEIGRISVARLSIAFELWRRRSNIVSLKNGHEVPVTAGQRADFAPEFSRDGKLAFFSEGGGLALWIKKPANNPMRLLKLPVQSATSPRWSPGGQTIAFIGHTGSRCTLYLVSAENAEVRHYDLPNEDTNAPAWDGDHLIVYPARAGARWKLRFFDQRESRLTPMSIDGWREVPSAGDTLYGIKEGTRGVWRFAPSTTAVNIAPTFDSAAAPEGWTVANHFLYTLDMRGGAQEASVLRQSLNGGTPEVVATGLDWADNSNATTGGLTVDPSDGAVFYAKNGFGDTDIGILRLVQP